MEMDRTSIVVLTILVSPFSIIFLIKGWLAALATSLTGGWGRRAEELTLVYLASLHFQP